MSDFERPEPAVMVFHWEAVSGDPSIGGQLEWEDHRELAFLDMAIRQFTAWEYLAARFRVEP